MNLARTRALAAIVAICAALAGCASASPPGKIRGSLTAIGTGAQVGAIQAWRQGWIKKFPETSLNYSPDGTDVGISALLSGQAHFAALDDPLTAQQVNDSKQVCGPDGAFSVPVTVIPIGVAFNLPSVKNLKLDAETLGAIFSGRIKNWDDPRITGLNPDEEFPDQEIVPVRATESSALANAATSYLASSTEWPAPPSRELPPIETGETVNKLSEVPQKVDDTAGSIAFIDKASNGSRFDTVLLKFGGDFIRLTDDTIAQAVGTGRTDLDAPGGVELSMDPKSPRGYALASVGYQAFCSSYKNDSLSRLAKSWAEFVVGEGGQSNSNYFAGVASPSEEVLEEAQQLVDGISTRR